MCKRKVLQSQEQTPSFTQCHSHTAKALAWRKWGNRNRNYFCLITSLGEEQKNPVYNICFSWGRAKLRAERSSEGLHAALAALSPAEAEGEMGLCASPVPPQQHPQPQLLPPTGLCPHWTGRQDRESKGLMWNSCRHRNAEMPSYAKQSEKQQHKLISKSVNQLNCSAVCFDIEWILVVHTRTAFHEQQFGTCSMVWVSYSGVPYWAITCLQFGWKHLQGTHGNLLWLAGRDGNVYEGSPLKQLRTTKTTIIAIEFELILLQNHFK